jgi:hypothetical protein
MILVTAAAFILFWLRDYWLLQIGSARRVVRRVWVYAGLVSFAGVLVWVFASTQDTAELIGAIESTPLLIGLLAFHALAAVACFWIKRTGSYHLAWLAAIVPAPVAWVLFARVVFSTKNTSDPAKAAMVGAFAALWILPIALTALKGRLLELRVEDLDYVLSFAGWINCLGCGLVVFAISPGAADSFQIAIRALTPAAH